LLTGTVGNLYWRSLDQVVPMCIGLLCSLKYCMTNPGPEEWLWGAGEPSEFVFTVVFACLFSRERFPDMNVQTSALWYCIVP